jgi:hypothetical protein
MPAPRSVAALGALLLALAAPAVALGAFPGTNPDESVRVNTPSDPGFDHCEPDDEQGADCSNVFDEQFELFGFGPQATQLTARYANPADTARQQAQNTKAGRNPLAQIPGVSADRAWKRSTGDPDVQIAILDTGIRWREAGLRTKVALNRGELPRPQAGATACADDDCNGDGAFNVDDYARDPRVSKAAGHDDEPDADQLLDASDLIATFSDGTDADANGYRDDVAGWDFFDDDNDPYDASSYSSASNHGTGRAMDAAESTNDGAGGAGMCPRCQIVPLRIWDTFVADTNNVAQAGLYAADNHIEVVEAAIGGLTSTSFVRDAMREAYRRGVFFTVVSSDLNTADHNSPTTYDEAMMVAGAVSDVHGLGTSDAEVGGFLGNLGLPTSAPVSTWFRNSGTTQYGGHAHVVMPAVTGSQATGLASGAAGLIASYARQRATPLEPNEIKQLMTLTAEDVVPENTVGLGVPDPAQKGWDQHFGYGRVDLGLALDRIADGKIPPQALITGPPWFSPYALERERSVPIDARLSARSASYGWKLQWAPGIEPAEGDFRTVGAGTETGRRDGRLGTIDLTQVRAALDARQGGGATTDPTAPSKGPGDQDPNEPAFTVRVLVDDAAGRHGEDRKVLFANRDASLHAGWPRRLGTGGEASQRMWDVDGNGRLDIVEADSSGALRVLAGDGKPVKAFNGGRPVQTLIAANVHRDAPAYRRVDPPREPLRTPAIGDVNGDGAADIVDTAGEHVYAWDLRGRALPGFPVRLDPSLSRPEDRTRQNHVKRGFLAAPSLGDLTGGPALEIVAPALDGHVYAFDGQARTLPGFPAGLHDPSLPGAEIIASAAIGDIAGDSRPEIVVPTQEFDDNAQTPGGSGPQDLVSLLRSGVTHILANAAGGSGRVYALDAQGRTLPGWPTKPNGAVPDALPLVGPGVEHALGDVDGDGRLEAVGNVATGEVEATNGDGTRAQTFDPTPATGELTDRSRVLNLFEHPVVADLDGLPGLEVMKGGVTLNQLVNLGIAVGQNLPYNHAMQAWNGQTGASLPAFPQAVEDYQLLSEPAVADVSDAPGMEVVGGTGLYLLRDMNHLGQEGAGFPKFTGGWIYATPAIGDVDGDGKLEVAVLTREGTSFLWDTDSPACGTNDQWWTARHDERGTAAAGTDTRPPAAPQGVRATRTATGALRVSFRAAGDDGTCGTAKAWALLGSRGPITGPRKRVRTLATGRGARSGRRQATRIGPRRRARHLAVAYRDEAGNWSAPVPVRTRR